MRQLRLRFGFCFVLCFLLLSFSAAFFALPASADPARVVRIGYIDYEGFFDKTDDGQFTGYGAELLARIADYTGWQYEYRFDTFANHLESLKDGSIDFICHAQKTDAREQTYLFSKYSTGGEASVLYARSGDNRFFYDDIDALQRAKVAFLASSFQNDAFAAYAANNALQYTPVYYDTQAECFAALDAGAVDTVAMGSLGGVKGYKVISLFGFDPFYFMTGQGDAALLEELDAALGQILAVDPTFFSQLYTRYYSGKTAGSDLRLTRQEAAFIASGQTVSVGLMRERSPLSYLNAQGEPEGMIVDTMNLIAEKTGLKFSYTMLDLGQTGYDFLTQNEGALVAGVARSAFAPSNPALIESDALQDETLVFVGRGGSEFRPDSPLVVALPANFINGQEVVSQLYPNFTYYLGTTTADCLHAVRDGRADIMLQNIYVVRQLLQSPLYEDLDTFPAYSYDEREVVVALPENELLLSIINKSLAGVTDDEKNDIVIAHTIAKPYIPKGTELLYKYRLPLVGIAILIVIVLALSAFMMLYRQQSYTAISRINDRLAVTNGQLRDAVAQADRASLAKSQFLARMSHEIRTPMNAIVGLTTIARAHLGDADRMKEYLGKIETSSHVLLGIINDVLDMSAIESEKMKIDASDFDLKQVLSGISTLYYTQCRDKGISFEITADLPQEQLIGDSLRVNQVLLNLVSNAFKFTPSGGSIKVSATETAQRDGDVYIRFVVADTGCGMSAEMKDRLFKPFEQESSRTAQQHGGSGLGLSIAKNLVEMMHGVIAVESVKGEGTTFTVDIPFGVSTAKNRPELPAKSLRALVLDNNPEEQAYTDAILKRIGVPHTSTGTIEHALELMGAAEQLGEPYNLLFIDWKLGGGTAERAIREARALYPPQELTIIVSTYDRGEAEIDARSAGADAFVTKPLFQSTVFDLLSGLSGGQYTKESGDPAAFDFSGLKVLLAEDNDLNSEIATELLQMVHLEVERAENGKVAVERFNASAPGEFALILMDIQMPLMNGYEATQAIRAGSHPDAKTIPIIAMTANAFSSDVSAAISAGMNSHIAKPIDTQALYTTLQKELAARQA